MAKVANEVAFGLENIGADRPRSGRGSTRRSPPSAPARSPSGRSPSSPAASCSACASRRRSRFDRGCCCSTSRRRSSTPTAAEAFFDLIERAAVCGARLRAAPGASARPCRPGALHGRRPHRRSTRRATRRSSGSPRTGRSTCRTVRDVVCSPARRLASRTATRPVLEDASLEVRRGEIVALTGPNGAGKTTLAQLAAGLLEPDVGRGRARARARISDAGSRAATSSPSACSTRSRSASDLGARARRARAASGSPARRAASARPVGRRARAARARGGARDRARPAGARRADARRRPGAQGRARRAAARPRRRGAERSSSRTICRGPPSVADRVVALRRAGGACRA